MRRRTTVAGLLLGLSALGLMGCESKEPDNLAETSAAAKSQPGADTPPAADSGKSAQELKSNKEGD